MTTEQEVKATLERATEWLDKQRREYGSLPSYSDELINDLVQLVESLGDKSIARTGEPLGERGEVEAFACKCRFTREPNGELLGKVTQITECNFHSWQRDAAIDAAMGAAPITRATESQESALKAAQTSDERCEHGVRWENPCFACRAAESAESALKEAQWVSVPLEPTEEMRIAGQMAIPALPHYEEYRQRTGNQDQPWAYAVACYKAMLAARDKPQPHEEG